MDSPYIWALILLHTQLGAGTAVPGLVAAKCGAHVTLSDREDTPRLLDNLKKSCDLNGLTIDDQKGGPTSFNKAINGVRIMAISWGVFSPDFLKLEPQDVILASDCFYDTKGVSTGKLGVQVAKMQARNTSFECCFVAADFEDVLVTVAYLMEKNSSCKFWTTYQERR